MTNGRRVPLAVAVVGLLVGAALLLMLPARSEPAPAPVAEIVVGEPAGPPGTLAPAPRSAVPEVVPPPAPIVGDDEDDEDDEDDADDDDGPGDDDD